MYYVYGLIDPRNNMPFYIGKGKNNRCYDHLKETLKNTNNKRKYYKIKKILSLGLEVYVYKFKENIKNEKEAYNIEEYYIREYGRIGFDELGILTNICLSSIPPSPKGRNVSDITKKKIGDAQRGMLNHRYGKKCSDEEKERKRQYNLKHNIVPPSNKGISHSKETKEKMSISAKGRIRTKEQIESWKLSNIKYYDLIFQNKEITISNYDLKLFCEKNLYSYCNLIKNNKVDIFKSYKDLKIKKSNHSCWK